MEVVVLVFGSGYCFFSCFFVCLFFVFFCFFLFFFVVFVAGGALLGGCNVLK